MSTNRLTLRTIKSPYLDVTKGSVLSLSELDNNFVFLKGQDILTGITIGTDLVLTRYNGGTITVDLLGAISGADNYTTGSTLNGSILSFDRTNSLSAYTVDLSSLLDDTNFYTTGSTIIGTTAYFDRTDALSAYTLDLSSLSDSVSADNGLNIISGNTVELGGILNKNTVISGATNNLTFGDVNSSLTQFNVNSILSTQTFSAPGIVDTSVVIDINPGQFNLDSVNTGGTETNSLDFNKNEFRVDANNFTNNEWSWLSVQPNSIGYRTEDTSTTKSSSLINTLNQISMDHTDGVGVNTQLFMGDLSAIFSYQTGATTYSVTINKDSLHLNGGDTNINLSNDEGVYTDDRVGSNAVGFEYATDYSANFTDLSMITKLFFDNNHKYTTGTTIVGTTAYFDRNDSLSAYTLDLSGVGGGTSNYGNIIFVSEVGPTGQTRNDVIGDITKPVALEWASQIATSGDTIHVKAGSYTATTTGSTGLSVNEVNHYFEEGAKVYKSTSGPMFSRDAFINGFSGGANVYGSGSFYGSGLCDYIYYTAGFSSFGPGYTGFYSTASVFEFDECLMSSGSFAVASGFGGSGGDFILKGKTRIVNSAGSAISLTGGVGEKAKIDCPYIASTVSGGFGIQIGTGGGGAQDAYVISDILENTAGGGVGAGITSVGSTGRLYCNASYIDYLNAGAVLPYRSIEVKARRVDRAWVGANVVDIDAHVGELQLGGFTTANVSLCDEFSILNSFTSNAVANINMSNVTGATNTFTGQGVLNLRSVDLVNTTATENPSMFSGFTTGPKQYLFNGANENINLLGRWDNGDTITYTAPLNSTLKIDTNAYIKDTKFNISCGVTSRLEVQGKTDDCQIDYSGGSIVMNGATMIVSNQDKQIITTPFSGSTVKVYSGGLNTNKFGPFTGATEIIKVDVTGVPAQITVNAETFTSTTGVTNATVAQELVSLMNASGTLTATAYQDTPGVDTYFYVESDIIGTGLNITYDSNTAFNEQIRFNSNGVTDTVGGIVIEDVDID